MDMSLESLENATFIVASGMNGTYRLFCFIIATTAFLTLPMPLAFGTKHCQDFSQ